MHLELHLSLVLLIFGNASAHLCFHVQFALLETFCRPPVKLLLALLDLLGDASAALQFRIESGLLGEPHYQFDLLLREPLLELPLDAPVSLALQLHPSLAEQLGDAPALLLLQLRLALLETCGELCVHLELEVALRLVGESALLDEVQ